MAILNESDYRDRGDGYVEVWSLGHYATKGFAKVRNHFYAPVLLETITAEEASNRFIEAANLHQKHKEFQDKQKINANIEENYFNLLPMEISGFKRGHLDHAWELEDDCGNYVISIPKKAAHENWNLKKLISWLDDQLSEGYGE